MKNVGWVTLANSTKPCIKLGLGSSKKLIRVVRVGFHTSTQPTAIIWRLDQTDPSCIHAPEHLVRK